MKYLTLALVPCLALIGASADPGLRLGAQKDEKVTLRNAPQAPTGVDPIAGTRTGTLVRVVLAESEVLDEGASTSSTSSDGLTLKLTMLNSSAHDLVATLWDLERQEIDTSAVKDERLFDFFMAAETDQSLAVHAAARAMVLAELGLRVRTERRDVTLWELREGEGGIDAEPEAPDMAASGNSTTMFNDRWTLEVDRDGVGEVVGLLRNMMRNHGGSPPIVDGTGLDGVYSYELEVPTGKGLAGIDAALSDQLNLRLVETSREVRVYVFEPLP